MLNDWNNRVPSIKETALDALGLIVIVVMIVMGVA